jgi:hypothetical protein
MKNWFIFLLLFFIILLFPAVFGEGYKKVQQLDFPICYGVILFKIVGAEPYNVNDVKMDGCDGVQSCTCTNSPQTVNFLALDNVSNTFDIITEFYIAPLIEYTGDPNVGYNPNEDNKRNLRFSIKVLPGPLGEETNGTSVSILAIFIIILIILIVVGVSLFFVMRYLKGSDVKNIKGGDKKKEVTKQKINSNTDDIQNYLNKLEKERRQ